MPSDYTIRGETGQALDGTFRLGLDLKATNASLTFENLGPDVLQWTCRTKDIDASDTTIPSVGQQIELWDEANTTRFFRGNVTQARVTNYGVQVIVEGPWQWLRKIDVTTSQTLNGSTDYRPTVIFETGSITSHITALLNRAITAGAPIAIGTLATTYDVPKLQLSMMTFADVLAELMRWVPDSVGWWNYSGTGNPTFNLSRRGSMTATTYTLGTSPLESFDLTGRPDLQPSRVEIKYIQRRADMRPEYQEQTSGTVVAGRVQTIGVSGKELDTFLPADNYESFVAKTIPGSSTISTLETNILSVIPEVIESRQKYAGAPTPEQVTLTYRGFRTFWNAVTSISNSIPYGYDLIPFGGLQFLDPATGAEVSLVGKNIVIATTVPDWASVIFANQQKIVIAGQVYSDHPKKLTEYVSTAIKTTDIGPAPEWFSNFPWNGEALNLAYYGFGVSFGANNPQKGYTGDWKWFDFRIDAFLTTSSYPTATTFYRPQDYEYLAPPTGLAGNLLAAQAFDPYEGQIRLKHATLPAITNWLAQKYNLAGSQAALASAGALARSVTYDLAEQTIDLDIGAPARFAFGTLGGKVRQTPQTNITIN